MANHLPHIDADPEGKGRPIGQEWDVVVGLRRWEHFEVEFSASLFQAGSAYGSLSGDTAYTTLLELPCNF